MRKSSYISALLTVAIATMAFAAPPLRVVHKKAATDAPQESNDLGWPSFSTATSSQDSSAFNPSPALFQDPGPASEPETQDETSEEDALKPYRRNPFWPIQYAKSKEEAHLAAVAAQKDPSRLVELEEEAKRRADGILSLPDEQWESMESRLPQVKGIMPSLFGDPRPAVSFRGQEYWNKYFHEGDMLSITNRGIIYNWTITNISYAVGRTGCRFGRTSAVTEDSSKQ